MRRLRNGMAAVLMAGLGVLATPGTALASISCQGLMKFQPEGTAFGTVAFRGRVICTAAVPSITVTVRMYRYDAVVGGNLLVSTATNTGTNTSYVEAIATSLCVPGIYSGQADMTVVWASGSPTSVSDSYDGVVIPCV